MRVRWAEARACGLGAGAERGPALTEREEGNRGVGRCVAAAGPKRPDGEKAPAREKRGRVLKGQLGLRGFEQGKETGPPCLGWEKRSGHGPGRAARVWFGLDSLGWVWVLENLYVFFYFKPNKPW